MNYYEILRVTSDRYYVTLGDRVVGEFSCYKKAEDYIFTMNTGEMLQAS